MINNYYKRLDIIRVLSCIAILFYHIGLLKGGYLAVCTFFVLSGYLAIVSAFKKDKFSLKDYYLSRLKKIYLPLLIVVFISVGIVSLTNIDWLNLKPETTSIIFGYNNYWQLNANLDYFVRHIESPFMHLWYIALLIQFELVFPLIFITFKKIGEKIHKLLPCILLGILGIVSYIFFVILANDGKLMIAYYNTFTRAFSLLLGLSLGFIHYYYGSFRFKDSELSKIIYPVYLLLLVLIFIFVGSTPLIMSIGMILTTIISLRVIDYSLVEDKESFIDKIISFLSKISYEVYLVQYPVIFLFQSTNLSSYITIPLIIIITLVISYLIHISLGIKKDDKNLLIKRIILIIVILLSIFGLYKYIITKDYTKDMNKLKNDLEENRKLIEEKQKQYKKKQQEEESEWDKLINNMSSTEEDLKEYVTNLKITGVGDSIMELCVKELYDVFPNGYFDAAENRTEYHSIDLIKELDRKGLLGDVVVLSLGTNGKCLGVCKDMLMEALGDRKVYWLNATRPDFDTFNPSLEETAKKYDNLTIIDWISIVKPHPEYLIRDGIHPNVRGRSFYAESIYNAIYEDLLSEYTSKIEKHREEVKNRKTFIGNDLLIGLYDDLTNSFKNSEFIIDKEFTYKSLRSKIDNLIKDNNLSNNIYLLLDKQSKLSEKEYKDLVKLCVDRNIYIIDLYNELDIEDVTIIDFSKDLKDNKDYLEIDGIHLTDKGNKALLEKIKEELN